MAKATNTLIDDAKTAIVHAQEKLSEAQSAIEKLAKRKSVFKDPDYRMDVQIILEWHTDLDSTFDDYKEAVDALEDKYEHTI